MTPILTGIFIVSFILMMIGEALNKKLMSLFFKMGTSLTLLAMAIINVVNLNSSSFSFLFLLPFAMFFGCIGDFTLGLKNLEDLKDKTKDILLIVGFLSFFVGHIIYFISFVNVLGLGKLYISAILSLNMIIMLYVLSKIKIMNFEKFLIPCMVYGYFLAFIVISLLVNAILNGGVTLTIFIFALLFIVSDLILMVLYFKPGKPFNRLVGIILTFFNLATYFAAQYGFVNLPIFIN